MNGYSYSKIKGDAANESSRSMDSSDYMPVPETSKPTSNPTPKPPEIKPDGIKNSNPNTQCSSEQEDDDQAEGNNGEMFDPKLRRNSSVSSAYALQLQAAVKKAFSMRRSSSISESYCRIHDQYVTIASPLDDEELNITGTRRSVKKKNNNKNRRDKILKAWKKIFGL